MDLRKQIEEFKPFNEQEQRDKEYFLKFINTFDDVLTRDNVFGHFTSSAWVVNKRRDKILLVYHNIMDGYIFPGGHADGERDLLPVAIREVEEETGLKASVVSDKIFGLWAGPVKGHIKRGKYVSAHTHLDISYLLEADDTGELRVKPDENQSVIWASFDEIGKSIKLVDFFEPIYENFIKKLKR